MSGGAQLRVENLQAYYGKSHVLHGVDLTVERGEIVSLLGRNGVGRSTTAKAIMGLVDCTGTVVFKGRDLTRLKTHEIAHLGVGYVPESRDTFPTLTVEENLRLGVKGRRPGRWSYDDMYRLFPRLKDRAHTEAGVLSGGEQQMLTLARTMMGDPELVIIDEPTEGLAPMIVELVANFLRELKERGLSILLIEQKLTIAMQISQRVYVMGHGHMVFHGTPDDLRANRLIRQEWLEV
ncbi:MAG: ABC transporter ATP-binding protein [Betaproteobacteria bacterium]|jgi:branched-chain amino acid transport system ATP-binding protein|nr:ABC transporter ATP-binding protein [Betaproteobacteria bacterium]MDH5208518.1 ABC transporter ATP-binding protein [Burkholderiaceae bacterium]